MIFVFNRISANYYLKIIRIQLLEKMDGKSAIDRHNRQTRRVARQRAAIQEREERGDYHEYPEDESEGEGDPIETPSSFQQASAEGSSSSSSSSSSKGNDNDHINMKKRNTDLSDFLLNVGKVWAKARMARA